MPSAHAPYDVADSTMAGHHFHFELYRDVKQGKGLKLLYLISPLRICPTIEKSLGLT